MAEKNDSSNIKILITPGLFAIFGTIIGGIVKGYFDIRPDQPETKYFNVIDKAHAEKTA